MLSSHKMSFMSKLYMKGRREEPCGSPNIITYEINILKGKLNIPIFLRQNLPHICKKTCKNTHVTRMHISIVIKINISIIMSHRHEP